MMITKFVIQDSIKYVTLHSNFHYYYVLMIFITLADS
jgi:hypothetical protein